MARDYEEYMFLVKPVIIKNKLKIYQIIGLVKYKSDTIKLKIEEFQKFEITKKIIKRFIEISEVNICFVNEKIFRKSSGNEKSLTLPFKFRVSKLTECTHKISLNELEISQNSNKFNKEDENVNHFYTIEKLDHF